jgi:hypothetical protein
MSLSLTTYSVGIGFGVGRPLLIDKRASIRTGSGSGAAVEVDLKNRLSPLLSGLMTSLRLSWAGVFTGGQQV